MTNKERKKYDAENERVHKMVKKLAAKLGTTVEDEIQRIKDNKIKIDLSDSTKSDL